MDNIKKKKKKEIEKAGEVREFENEIQGEGCKTTVPLIRNLLALGRECWHHTLHWITEWHQAWWCRVGQWYGVRLEADTVLRLFANCHSEKLLPDQVSKMQLCQYKDFLSDLNAAACPFLFSFLSKAFWWNLLNCLELRSLKPWIHSRSTNMPKCICELSF